MSKEKHVFGGFTKDCELRYDASMGEATHFRILSTGRIMYYRIHTSKDGKQRPKYVDAQGNWSFHTRGSLADNINLLRPIKELHYADNK